MNSSSGSTKAVTPGTLAGRTANLTRRGLIELATTGETRAGTDTARAVTPAALNNRTATTGRTGLIQLATQAEVTAGTNTNKAVTPATLPTASNVPAASTTQAGIVELATQAEVDAGTDTTKVITPATLPTSSGGVALQVATLGAFTLTQTGTGTRSQLLPDLTFILEIGQYLIMLSGGVYEPLTGATPSLRIQLRMSSTNIIDYTVDPEDVKQQLTTKMVLHNEATRRSLVCFVTIRAARLTSTVLNSMVVTAIKLS